MDFPSTLAKITGIALLVWTGRSIYRQFFAKGNNQKTAAPAAGAAATASRPSISESFLNNLLLYLWLAFMVIFSVGMILNN